MKKLKIFKILSFTLLISLSFCSQASSRSYNAAILEGQTAAQKLIDQHQASAITIALMDADHVIWSQAFGLADPLTGQAATDSTMFGIGSVSKMLATIAVMKLVDQGEIDLDTPLVNYLPNFKMASPGYEKITVRMLVNHSAGFPGTDYRNTLIRHRTPDYLDQILQTLSQSRLKTAPGFMSVYCNDCFTMVEALVKEKTGKRYDLYVQDEIFTPLKMFNSRYPTQDFPDGSYAKFSKDGVIKPQEYVNTFGSGGAYSTANDLARIGMMFLGKGAVGSTRLLSESSVAKMAVDQTSQNFNPAHNASWTYGLGWDSVTQAGLKAVGFDGWAKAGDTDDYGSMLIVSPKAGLAIAVIGASGLHSEQAKALAERILLRALVENGQIASFPTPLPAILPEEALASENQPALISGKYASSQSILKFYKQDDESMLAAIFSAAGWTPAAGLAMNDLGKGWFASSKLPMLAFKAMTTTLHGKETKYLLARSPSGYGHYLDNDVYAQDLPKKSQNLSAVWRARLPLTWLVVNANSDELHWNEMDPRLRIAQVPGRKGYVSFSPPGNGQSFQIVDPSSDNQAKMMLTIPLLNGRDLNDLNFVKQGKEEWASFGSYLYRPLASVPVFSSAKTETITIGSKEHAEWRAIAQQANPIQIKLTSNGPWQLYDSSFKSVASGTGSAVVTLPAGSGLAYLTVFGEAGQLITLEVKENKRDTNS